MINMIAVLMTSLALYVQSSLGIDDQFGPLMKPFLPLGERLPGFPEVFPGLSTDSPKYLLFPEDSAAIHEDSINRCRAMNGKLASVTGPLELETFGYLLASPAYIGDWQGKPAKGCRIVVPGGYIVGTIF